MKDITIRDYRKTDATELMRMWRETVHMWPMGAPHPTEVSVSVFNRHLEGSGALEHWVAVDESLARIVGYCAFSRDTVVTEHMEVSLLNTHPDWQGQGIGKQMLLKCIDATVKLKSPALFLGTWPGNEQACGLYKRLGFFHTPGSDIGFVNFIPSVLQCGLLGKYIDETNWYSTLKRDTSYGPDTFTDGKMKVFPYLFQTDSGQVEVGFERHSNGLYRLETPELKLSLKTDFDKGWKGFPRVFTLNRETTGPLDVDWNVSFSGLKGLKCQQMTTFNSGKIRETHDLSVEIPADLSLEETEVPQLKVVVARGGTVLATLHCGFKPVESIEAESLRMKSFVPAGANARRYMNLTNNLDSAVSATFQLDCPQGLHVTPSEFTIDLASGETRAVDLSIDGAVGKYAMKCSGRLKQNRRLIPEQTIPVAITSPDKVSCLEDKHLIFAQNSFYRFVLSKKRGCISVSPVSDKRCSLGMVPVSAGPPFPNYGLDGVAQYEISDSGSDIEIMMTIPSRQFKGLTAFQKVSLNASPVLTLDAWLEVDTPPAGDVQMRQRVTETGYLRNTVFPVDDAVLSLNSNGGVSVENHLDLSGFLKKESWLAMEGNGSVAACIWSRQPENIEIGTYYAVTLSQSMKELEAGGRIDAPRTWFYAGPGNQQTIREVWMGFQDKKTAVIQPVEPITVSDAPVIFRPGDKDLKLSLSSLLKKPESISLNLDAVPELQIAKQTVPATDISSESSRTISVPVDGAITRSMVTTLRGSIVATQWESQFTVPVIAVKHNDVKYSKSRQGRYAVHTLTQGPIEVDVAPAFCGHVTSLRWNGSECLKTMFPKPGVLGFEKPYYGGITPALESRNENYSEQKISGRGRLVTEKDATGLTWKGMAVTCKVNERSPLKGSRVICKYLLSPELPILRVLLELDNRSKRVAHGNLLSIVSPFNPAMDEPMTVRYEENGKKRAYRRGVVGASLAFDRSFSFDYGRKRPAFHLKVPGDGDYSFDLIDTGQGTVYAYVMYPEWMNPGQNQHIELLIGLGDVGFV